MPLDTGESNGQRPLSSRRTGKRRVGRDVKRFVDEGVKGLLPWLESESEATPVNRGDGGVVTALLCPPKNKYFFARERMPPAYSTHEHQCASIEDKSWFRCGEKLSCGHQSG